MSLERQTSSKQLAIRAPQDFVCTVVRTGLAEIRLVTKVSSEMMAQQSYSEREEWER